MKSILAVHDFSCHGAASLGIALPVLTACGYKVAALPTVLLSSTTDIDDNPVVLSTTDWMEKVVARWKEQKIKFDAIYTGWLGDPKQIPLLLDAFEKFSKDNTTVLVDPVLGDGGEPYPCQSELSKAMKDLVAKANVITPNPTEAALLLGKSPADLGVKKDGTVSVDGANSLVNALSEAYPRAVPIVKSVVSGNQIGVCVKFTSANTAGVLKPTTRTLLSARSSRPPMGGTGDLFASLLLARWLRSGIDAKSSQYQKILVIGSASESMSGMMKMAEKEKTNDLPFRKLLHAQ